MLPADYAVRMRKAGLTVIEEPGWRTRGRPGSFRPVGDLQHHTGTSARGWDKTRERQYARWLFTTGRSDLPAPLCQRSTAPDGTVYLGAAGRANHAGRAKAVGSVAAGDGNSLYVGNEWMVSGGEQIPQALYDSAVTQSAVTLHMLGSSVRADAAHFETSITGKWDPGEHGKPINMNTFRKAVEKRMTELYAPRPNPQPGGERVPLHIAQWSTQFSDSNAQKRADAHAVFSLGYDFIGITEASKSKAGKKTRKIVREAAAAHGYLVRFGNGDTGVAVRAASIVGGIKKEGYTKVASARGGATPHGERGIQWIQVQHATLGPIRVATVHYLTRRTPGHAETNKRYARAIGDWAQQHGKGDRLAFVTGDMNMDDETRDVFLGEPLTTCWDDRKKWPSTHEGGRETIDIIARCNGDVRTGKAAAVKVWKDKDLGIFGDHYPVVARYDILKKG